MKKITEQQIRKIVIQELKNVLFEQDEKTFMPQGKKVRIIGSLLAALFMTALSGHEGGGIGGASAGDGKGGGSPTVEQILEELGLSQEYLNELRGKFDIEDIKKLASLGMQEKEIEKQIDEEKAKGANADQDLIEDLEQQKFKIFSGETVSPELLSKIENAGSSIVSYIYDLDEEQLKELEDTDVNQLTQTVQSKAFAKSINPKHLSTKMSRQLSSDATKLYRSLADQGYMLNVSSDPQTNLEISLVQRYDDQLPETFTLLDAIKIAAEDQALNYESDFLNTPYYKEPLLKKFDSNLNKVSKEEIKAKAMGVSEEELAQTKGNVQENKINKLRQRLNELRGVYV
jgi:hypothetical protein